MYIAGNQNLTIPIGDTFSTALTFYSDEAKTQTIDVTGYTFKGQVRKCKNSSTVILEFVSPTTVDMTLASVGKVILKASAAVTGALAEENAVWDFKWTDTSGNVLTLIKGSVSIIETVTKP